jgi:molybdopterin-binding protein
MEDTYRIGQAAAVLGVRTETLRRWERNGTLKTIRTPGGQRLVPVSEVTRLLSERRDRTPPIVAQSTRNRFPGTIVEVKRGDVAATVEIVAGPHRILSLVTREAVDQLGLKPGLEAIAVVKATSVMIELPE